ARRAARLARKHRLRRRLDRASGLLARRLAGGRARAAADDVLLAVAAERDLLLAEPGGDALRRKRAALHPECEALLIDFPLDAGRKKRVVVAELLDHAPVAPRARIEDANPEEGSVEPARAGHPDANCHEVILACVASPGPPPGGPCVPTS